MERKTYLVTVPEGSKIAETGNVLLFDAPRKDREMYRVKTSALDEARTAGQLEAWALAQKIHRSCVDGGYTSAEINDIFGYADPLSKFSYKEAAKKADAWEEEHRMLEVGTVVRVVNKNFTCFGKRGVIIDTADTITGPAYLVAFRNGESRMLRHGEIERVALYDLGPLFALMEEEE
jgi:hypothetical protein